MSKTISDMMSKEEYLAKAAARYDALEKLKDQKDFYNYEAEFDKIWTDLCREVLESSISEMPENHRKKHCPHPLRAAPSRQTPSV
jgi:hypothetical protein